MCVGVTVKDLFFHNLVMVLYFTCFNPWIKCMICNESIICFNVCLNKPALWVDYITFDPKNYAELRPCLSAVVNLIVFE